MKKILLLIVISFALKGFSGDKKKDENLILKLPKAATESKFSLEESIAKRRSIRNFAAVNLTEKEIGQILWAAQGTTDPKRGFRASPSAGATYPLETYAFTEKGVFQYLSKEHALKTISSEDMRAELSEASLGQQCVATAPLVILLTAIPERTMKRYGARGKIYIFMEAGHTAQNIHLQAVALGLGSVPVGAFREKAVSKILALPKNETPVYIIPIGKPIK